MNSLNTTTEDINYGRKTCFEAFKETLAEFRGKKNVTEIILRDTWLRKISTNNRMTDHGWYSPPPYGMAVLFADDVNPERIGFPSLREKEYYPSDRTLDWGNGLIYAYASNIDIQSSLPGDFGITLYFGTNDTVIEHFKNCYQSAQEVLSFLGRTNSSVELFHKSQMVFRERGLQNCIVSYTDTEPLDLGHSILLAGDVALQKHELSSTTTNSLRTQRKFINSSVDWKLSAVEQFTIEPRLKTIKEAGLPQVSFHYLATKKQSFQFANECDSLFCFLNQ